MSASNYSWVCFECHLVVRQPKTAKRVPSCVDCGTDLFCLGYKVEVPKKEDIRGWRRLRDDCRDRAIDAADVRTITRVREQHDAERRIAQLSTLPANKERAMLMAALREKTPNQASQPTPPKRRG